MSVNFASSDIIHHITYNKDEKKRKKREKKEKKEKKEKRKV